MKQTAVEWLINEMPIIDWTDPYWKRKLNIAKEMEKQQIIDAYKSGINCISDQDADFYYTINYKHFYPIK